MTPEERRAFFEKEGYWPTTYVPRKFSAKELAAQQAKRLQMASRLSTLRGWKAPLHWLEPPLFRNPGAMYEELGHEEFSRQVEEYYAAIREQHCSKAHREHIRWAIRQVLRNFETQVRGFRGQSVGRKGSIFGKSSGQEYHKASRTYSDILVLPEDLASEDGRLVHEIEGHLRAYAVPEEELALTTRIVKARLRATWGVRL
jgi:hypothetical protein